MKNFIEYITEKYSYLDKRKENIIKDYIEKNYIEKIKSDISKVDYNKLLGNDFDYYNIYDDLIVKYFHEIYKIFKKDINFTDSIPSIHNSINRIFKKLYNKQNFIQNFRNRMIDILSKDIDLYIQYMNEDSLGFYDKDIIKPIQQNLIKKHPFNFKKLKENNIEIHPDIKEEYYDLDFSSELGTI